MRRWLVVVAAGCLSEPSRPHGLGAPIAAGSILRHKTAVGDLDGDGYDDLVIWGNDSAPHTNPTVFVYFGGETLENPDVRLDLAIVPAMPDTFASYEAIDASVFVSADGSVRGVLAYSGQAHNADGSSRANYASFFPTDGRGFGDRQHSEDGVIRDIGGDAPDSGGVLAIMRDTVASLPARQVLFGGGSIFALPAPLDTTTSVSEVGFAYPTTEYMQETLVLPADGASEDLLVIDQADAYRTQGDLDPASKSFALGAKVPLAGGGNRFGRGRAVGDTFYAVASTQFDNTIPVIAVPRTGDPVAYGLAVNAQPDDLAIADAGGASDVDVVALESGTLGVYRDLALAGSAATPAATFGSRDALAGYDLIAVGNFHGDARLEIYVLSTVHPEQPIRCYRVDGDQMNACAGE